MSSNKKLEEGFAKMTLAEKSLKTSFFKWRPDYEVAAEEYNQAATCFKIAKFFEKSRDCLLKAAECHKQNHSFFHAAKCMDQVILLSKDLNDYKEVAQLAEKACDLYQQHGSPESGAATLDKAAKILEQTKPEQALRLYQRAADVMMIEDNLNHAAEYFNKVTRICVKLKMYDKAVESTRQEIVIHTKTDNVPAIGRLVVCLILIHFGRGDYVAAEKAFKEWGGYCNEIEFQNMELLLQGMDGENPETVQRALNHPFIKHMDVEFAKLARELSLSQALSDSNLNGSLVKENTNVGYVSSYSSSYGNDKETNGTDGKARFVEEEEEGLC